MSILVESYSQAAIQLNLHTKDGYQGENCLHIQGCQPKRPSAFCAGIDLKLANNCMRCAGSPSEEMATEWHT
jgi:hypothetical protein